MFPLVPQVGKDAQEPAVGAPTLVMPVAVGQPQNWVGAGVAVSAFSCGGNAAPAMVALAVFVALKPVAIFAAA